MHEIAGRYRFGSLTARAELWDGGCVARRAHVLVAASARLDRRDDLVRRLNIDACAGDAELVAAAYLKWGPECAEALDGDFSCAIWDERERRLICIRDRMGVRPLYYFVSSTEFAFASRMNTLLAFEGVPRRINEAKAIDFLVAQPDDTTTFYKDVRRLPPAHLAVVGNGRLRVQRYWRIDPERQLILSSAADYEDAYRDVFTSAVAERLRSRERIGSLLSGGVDSSSIVCTALRLRPDEPLETFSLVFDDVPESDERRYILAVADHGPVNAHLISGDGLDPLVELDECLERLGQPFIAPNLFLSRRLWSAASAHGFSAVLDGFLGDQIVGHGSRRLTELFFQFHWLRLSRELGAAARRCDRPARGAVELIHRFVVAPLLPIGSTAARFVHRDVHERVRQQRVPRSDREEHLRELTSGILSSALEVVWASAAAYGIEARFPFADRRVVEYCCSVPSEQKCRGGRTRVYARRAMAELLPEAVRKRGGKANLAPVFRRSLLHAGRDAMNEAVFERMSAAAAFVDVAQLQEAWTKGIRDRGDLSDDALLSIWYAVVLARWLEREKHCIGNAARPSLRLEQV